jgi:hypothetical protein
MVILGQNKPNVNQSDDSGDYVASFYRGALFLIVAGYERLVTGGTDYSDTAEEHITGELTQRTEEYINTQDSPDWTKYYVVQEERLENVRGKKGKYRPRVDIAFVRTDRRPQRWMRFEAKRLRKPGFTVGKYIGKEGLGEFIAGNYAAGDDTAGMLGYVQSDDCDYWARKISETIEKKKQEVGLIERDQWQKAHFDYVDHCYKTRHNRPRIKRELLIYHLLLAFQKTA